MKSCISCKELKNLDNFRLIKSSNGKIYRRSVCGQCRDKSGSKEKRLARHKRHNDKRLKTKIYKDYRTKYEKTKYHTDPIYKLRFILRRRFRCALKNNSKKGSAVKFLGCSIQFFKEYIQNKFIENMTWENHGQWHLDHIKPLSSFNLLDENDLKLALHYTNYQPLWAKDNLSKGAKCE